MSTAAQKEPELSSGTELPFDGSVNNKACNDVESLRKGIIKTKNNHTPYTILLVGETGTGKSSLLEIIANVLLSKNVDCYDFGILDRSNEQGGSSGQSQTNSAHIYEFTSKNGISVRILDTPGLADTHGIQQDELHKKSIATQIHEHIATVSAVLILANGSVPRITVGMDYALSALSALFPKTLAKNIAFVFTNSPTYLSLNFSQDAIPEILKDAPQFLFDNPIALQRKYLEFKDDPSKKRAMTELQRTVKRAEEQALEMFADLFDWLDGLEPQPTMAIVALYEKSQAIDAKITNTLAQMDQAAAKITEINKLMEELRRKSTDMHTFSNFEKIINALVWKQQPASTLNYLCTAPNCYSTCGVDHSVGGVLFLFPKQLSSCFKCKHPHFSHFHLHSTWVQVEETQTSIDDNIKQQWEAAKDEKEKTAALVATSERALGDLNRVTQHAMDELAGWAAEYAGLSLAGSFSAHMEKATLLMKQRCKTMEEKGVGVEQLAKMRRSVEQMEGRLNLLREAREGVKKVKEKVREGIWKFKEVQAPEGGREVEESQDGVQGVEEVQEGVSNGEVEIQEGPRKVWRKVWEKVGLGKRSRAGAKARKSMLRR